VSCLLAERRTREWPQQEGDYESILLALSKGGWANSSTLFKPCQVLLINEGFGLVPRVIGKIQKKIPFNIMIVYFWTRDNLNYYKLKCLTRLCVLRSFFIINILYTL
jgi:hypothetical protein